MIVHAKHSPAQSHRAAAKQARHGLSLLEVLTALAIFLFSLVALGQLIDIGSANALDIDWLGRSSLIAQSRMAEVLTGSITLASQGETSCDEDPDWNWALDAEPNGPPGLYNVKITVSRNRPDGSRFETVLNQMVLDPTYRGTADGSDDTTGTSTGTSTGSTTTGTTGSSTTGGP